MTIFDQEADHDDRIGERSACEDERAGPGYKGAGCCRVLDRWLGTPQIGERERNQEHDEAGDPERARPASHFGVVHNKGNLSCSLVFGRTALAV